MIVRRIESLHALFPLSRLLLLFVGLLAPSVYAHAPFDSNARVTVLEQTIEATVTVGTGLTELLLKDSSVHSFPNQGVGMGTILPVELAARFFEMEAGGQNIPATQLRVLSDGLEALFIVTYPRPTSEAFRLRAQFARHLPGSNFCALVVTDDNNQLLGSHLVKSGSAAADFNLPQRPGVIIEAATPVSVVAQLAAPAEAMAATTTPNPSHPRPRLGALTISAVIFALGGAWLIRKTFRREPN
jgi:hypothetical protein